MQSNGQSFCDRKHEADDSVKLGEDLFHGIKPEQLTILSSRHGFVANVLSRQRAVP